MGGFGCLKIICLELTHLIHRPNVEQQQKKQTIKIQ